MNECKEDFRESTQESKNVRKNTPPPHSLLILIMGVGKGGCSGYEFQKRIPKNGKTSERNEFRKIVKLRRQTNSVQARNYPESKTGKKATKLTHPELIGCLTLLIGTN
jgi:hypothetical protein